MTAGKYNQLVTIQAPSATTDSIGGQPTSWVDVRQGWAEIKPMSGREVQAAQQLNSGAMYRIAMRAQPLTTSQRLVWHAAGGALLNIRAVMPSGRGGGEIIVTAESGMGI